MNEKIYSDAFHLLLYRPFCAINSKYYQRNEKQGRTIGVDYMESFTMMRRGRIQDLDRSFDLQFWQKQEPKARFEAAWELILHAWRVKGGDVRQLRIQRSVENFQRQQR